MFIITGAFSIAGAIIPHLERAATGLGVPSPLPVTVTQPAGVLWPPFESRQQVPHP